MRPWRAMTVNRLLVAGAVGCFIAAGGMATARADGVLNAHESEYVAQYGEWVVCASLNGTPTPAAVITVVKAVMEDGFAPDSAVDIVNASVQVYCPERWGLLQKVGRMARGETQA